MLIYSNTFNHGFVLDDDVVYLKNSFVQKGFGGLTDIFSHGFLYGFNQRNDQSYRPLVLANFAIEHQIFGNNPKAHHVIGVLIYSLVCLILYQFLLLLFRDQSPWLAFWMALLFAVHPIHTEVVANIKGRDELLHALFLLLSLKFLLISVDRSRSKELCYALCFLFLALLCKEMAITVLGLVPLVLFVFRKMDIQSSLTKTSYFLIPLTVYFLLRKSVLDDLAFEDQMTVINNSLAAAHNWQEHLASGMLILMKYLQLIIFPKDLAWDYSIPYFRIVGLSDPRALISTILVLVSIVYAIYMVFKKRSHIATGWLFFIISFSIVSNFFILIGCTLGERFLFFSSIGLFMAIGFLIKAIVENGFAIKKAKLKRMNYLPLVPLIFLSFKTIERNKDWASNDTLFKAGMEVTPNNSRAVAAYASIFRAEAEASPNPQIKQRQFLEAIKWYEQSLKLYDQVADTWYNLGVSYMGVAQQEKAKFAFEQALSIDDRHINALNNLGVIHFQNKDFQSALTYFERCLKVNAQFASAHANLGAVFHNLGQYDKARLYYNQALQLNPKDQNTRINLSKLQ